MIKAHWSIRFILILYSSFLAGHALAAPGPSVTGKPEPGKIIDTVVCKADPAQSYALYIPVKGNAAVLPVIYFFDPHADGALPLKKYKSLADAYGFILVGSNNSKNGNDWPATENIWRHLFDDTQDRLKTDRHRIYTCGFSGGAKVAGFIALQHSVVKGVIAGGAGLPDGTPAGDFNFSFTAIAGEGDMNLTDLVAINNDLDKSRTRHRIIFFDGKHEWAPENSMNKAFAGLEFDAMQAGLISKDKPFITRYIAKSKNIINGCYTTHQLIKAGQECKISISFLDGLTGEVAWFKEKLTALSSNTAYQEEQKAQENLLVREQNTKAVYTQHFQQADIPYWTTTITGLQKKAGAKTAEGAMYQRLLAYLSLAFYSISNHLINGNANTEARHFVELYKMADPGNIEAWYFSALLHARDDQMSAAENDLHRAVQLGFKDRDRVRQQPEFKKSRNIYRY